MANVWDTEDAALKIKIQYSMKYMKGINKKDHQKTVNQKTASKRHDTSRVNTTVLTN